MVGMISAVIAVTGAIFTAGSGYWWQARLRAGERLDHMSRYRDSLLWAAYDLQSRIYNILYGYEADRRGIRKGFLRAFLLDGSEHRATYVRCSTAYVFAEYLGWAEIFRRDIQFLDLGKNHRNQRTMFLLSSIAEIMSDASRKKGDVFRIFRAEQRGIGELMITQDSRPGERRCLGYAEFRRRIAEGGEFYEWMETLLGQVDVAAREPEAAETRLLELQHRLVDLIDLIDPKKLRFPAEIRTRFGTAASAVRTG
ncbi:MAG: hypothetical protein ACRDP6_37000 [Actinoallomurus sp.]